jgi:hypothetical protein
MHVLSTAWALEAAVRAFSPESPRDDIAILVVRRNSPQAVTAIRK